VVKKSVIRTAANPNKLHKSLAPWFSEDCRAAKLAYKVAIKRFGRHSTEAKKSSTEFSKACQSARNTFSAQLPDLMKYQPRAFWAYAHSHPHSAPAVPPQHFASFMGGLFFDPEAGPEAAPVVPIHSFEPITAEELDGARSRFRGAASSGMCPLPSQVIKHLAGECLEPMASFFNKCVVEGRPPTAWR
jgi:hypothetical protein